jgi:hypothetical protein
MSPPINAITPSGWEAHTEEVGEQSSMPTVPSREVLRSAALREHAAAMAERELMRREAQSGMEILEKSDQSNS